MTMRGRALFGTAALAAAVAVAPGVTAVAAQAASHTQAATAECATVKVTAKPGLNTAMIPETIKSTVTNCATATETVVLDQHISGPFAARSPLRDRRQTITLAAGQSVTKTRSFPYTCCGSYTVTDKVLAESGTLLAKSAANFTFA